MENIYERGLIFLKRILKESVNIKIWLFVWFNLLIYFSYRYGKIYLTDIAVIVLIMLLFYHTVKSKKFHLPRIIKIFILPMVAISILNIPSANFGSLIHFITSLLLFTLMVMNDDLFRKNQKMIEKNIITLIYLFFAVVLIQFIVLNLLKYNMDLSLGLMDEGGQRSFQTNWLKRPSGLYVEPAHQALVLIMLWIISVLLKIKSIYQLVLMLTILLTMSTLGLFAVFIMVFYYVFASNQINKKIFFLLFVLSAIVLHEFIIYSFDKVIKILEFGRMDDSANIRLAGPLVILGKMSVQQILFGIGMGKVDSFLIDNSMHPGGGALYGSNSFLHYLMDMGIFAFLIMTSLKVYIFFFKVKNKLFNIFLFSVFLIFDFGGDFSYMGWYFFFLFLINFSFQSTEINKPEWQQ